MPDATIENPVINSPYSEPSRHFRFTDDGITNVIVDGRRRSEYLIPVPPPKHKGAKQLQIEAEHMPGRRQDNELINQIRERVKVWRNSGYAGVTSTTRALLDHWHVGERDKPFFFCQLEAVETAIYLTEVATKGSDTWIDNRLRDYARDYNPDLVRMAFKMATGSGKTTVMALMIAWHVLNKAANPQDKRFNDAFLIVTPGITIRDRLRVLLPSDPDTYFRRWNVVPPDLMGQMGGAKIIITNYHAFLRREKVKAASLTKSILIGDKGADSPFTETPDEMVRRVCREFGNKRDIVVINDEAHHCYRPRAVEATEGDGGAADGKLTKDEKDEAKQSEEAARVWLSGLEAVNAKVGIRATYDLSATPFFLKGSGYPEGTLFPWCVSDFALIDAIESGIVKIPRVPVADNSMAADTPAYRDLWPSIRDALPRKGRGQEALAAQPKLPTELEGALHSLYGNYVKYYEAWQAAAGDDGGQTPPVFIVVCNNTSVSKLVFDYIAGWEKVLDDGRTVLVPGQLPLFSNVERDSWSARPNTVLIDSEQLESGEAMSADFKRIAAREIDEFKREYRIRFPGRDPEKLEDEDLLREVMNTVGKPGKLGEQIKCVVSVSMLTEGWDANTVTHILGVRAFGTQLLCEQVVGRALRRTTYAVNDEGLFEPEYAEVYGVPFSFIPTGGDPTPPGPDKPITHVRAIEERIALEITFPRVTGYRFDLPSDHIEARFGDKSQLVLSTESIPTKVENAPIIGESAVHTLDELKSHRIQEVVFALAARTLDKLQSQDAPRPWLFPQLLRISQRWVDECLVCKDDAFPQMLLFVENADNAADRIRQAIVTSQTGDRRLLPILRPYDTIGSTRYVDFDTVRPVYVTAADSCHVSHVAEHSRWEAKLAETLEDMDEVACYVKNDGLGFTIPYTIDGEQRNYIPDFIARVRRGDDIVNLIIEVTGEKKPDKHAKVATTADMWVPAVNNHGGYGTWMFVEIQDPYEAKALIRSVLAGKPAPGSQMSVEQPEQES